MRILTFFLFLASIQFSFSQNYSYSTIPEELLKNANAIARLDEMNIQIEAIDKMTYNVRQVVTVLNKEGDRYARTSASYDKQRKIKKIEAFVYDGSGEELEHIKRKDFRDIAAVDGFSLYLDDRILYYRYVPTQYPYTLEFTYEIETTDTGAFPSWYFVSGYGLSVEKSNYTISYPSEELKPIIKEQNLSGIAFQKTNDSNITGYTSDGIAAIKQESLSPPFNKLSPKLSVRLPNFHYKGFNAKIDNWKEMGIWIDEKLLSGRTKLDEGTIAKAKTLVNGIEDDLEKAKIIYQYVQENTRYISVQIGIGGFQPISAVEVDRVKYGDCKGLSNYTKALLEAVNVESYYAVVQAGNTKVDFEDDFADLIQGNHAILAIPYNNKLHWIDCTSQVHPFGFIGDFTDDRKVLVVKPEGGEIVRTTAYINEDNHQKVEGKYKILEDLSIVGETTIKTQGVQYDNRFGLETDSKEDVIKHYKNAWNNINGLKIKTYNFDNDKNKIVFTEEVTMEATDYVSKTGEDLIFTLNAFNNNNYVPTRYRNRKMPFRIQRGYLDEDEYVIEIPESFQFNALPAKIAKETKFGSYEMEVLKKNENQLLYKRKLLIKKGDYTKEEYGDYRSFRRFIAKNDNQKIVLTNQKQ
ncbi:DUF3857 domain-containing protein [Flagellimonas sp.]|uniref:DUF3857 domain-containing protein n=1 Tax=Flagellimonas sp. TaxID=2058762 RepID=UPI003B5A7113